MQPNTFIVTRRTPIGFEYLREPGNWTRSVGEARQYYSRDVANRVCNTWGGTAAVSIVFAQEWSNVARQSQTFA